MLPVTIEGDEFVQGGKAVQLVAGAIHYFRVVPDYWEDRLTKLRACGFNALETYVAWNAHEPRPGRFRFDGMLDIERYVRIAADLGLMVIVRPGPYICSEWDLGGLPSWLLADGDMRLRCAHPPYLEAVDRFYDELIPRLSALQATRGGPIVAMQIENEYGSYGNDRDYLRHLELGLRSRGFKGALFTSDGASDWMLQGGTLPHILKVANFGSGPAESFAKLREYQPTGPLMCGEFWAGWFDHWGEEHHRRDGAEAARVLDEMLTSGASVSVYMFHGGTNFGFMNGANCGERYEPTITSYDSDAALNEAGDPTPKYFAYREVVTKHMGPPEMDVPPFTPKAAYGRVAMIESVPLFDALAELSTLVERPTPEPMERLGQDYGFILYRCGVDGPREPLPLVLQDVRDRALVFVDGGYEGVIDRSGPQEDIVLGFTPGPHQLDILVENMGRVNYGRYLHDRKGITEGVRLGGSYGAFLFGWTIFPLPLDDLSRLRFRDGAEGRGPAFYRGRFGIDDRRDTFLALPGWAKGVCFLNGFNLGRYWEVGPQRTLYVPAPLLREGENELIVFELHSTDDASVELVDTPDLG